MEMIHTPKIAFNSRNIPVEMRNVKRWITWKLKSREDNSLRLEKVPYSPMCNDGNSPINPNEAKNWLPFASVACAVDLAKNKYSGAGFVLSSQDNICAIDIDNCFNSDGTLNDFAREVLEICGNSYAEKSQSGNGIHIFVNDSEYTDNRKGIIEVYSDKRFIAVTGEKINNTTEIISVNGTCTKLVKKYLGEKIKHTGELPPMCFDELDILDSTERAAINYFCSDKCKQRDPNIYYLFKDGNFNAYFERRETLEYGADDTSQSNADIILMLKIFFYVGDPADDSKTKERVLKVFNKSALALRDKWQNRDDYKTRTLQQAFNIWVNNGKHSITKKATDDFDIIPDGISLFEGLEKIKPTAGNILQVISAEHKAALNALFRNRNFSEFQSAIPEPAKYLQWLSDVLYQFFDNPVELKLFISEKLRKCNVPCPDDFAVTSTGDKFDFTKHFKIQLEKFANHSENIKKSLIRLDYQTTKTFLYKSFTHLECAELLIDIQSDFLRYDVKQDDWYVWDKNKWECVEVPSNSRILDLWTPLARKTRVLAEFEKFKRYTELAEFEIDNPDYGQKGTSKNEIWKKYCKEADRADKKFKQTLILENSMTVSNVLIMTAGLPEVKVVTSDFNKNKFLLNCQNVTVDLQRMEAYPALREDLITMSAPVIYDPSKRSELWLDFITYALPDDDTRNWLQKYLGYCLTGDTSQQIFLMIFGIGGCGKSVTFETIAKVLGDYAESFSPDLITSNTKQRDGNEPSPELASLRNTRLAVSSETERGKRFDEPKIKRLTGGNTLSVRKLHKPPFQFEPQFKIVIDGNYRLNISDVKDSGLQRRIRIIKFDNPPDNPDPTLADKLTTPENKSGILNWLIEGYQKFQKEGLPKPGDADFPANMQKEIEEFYAANDTIHDFISDYGYACAEQNSKNRTAVKDIWDDYTEWTRSNRISKLLRNDFIQSILQMFKGKIKLINVKHKDYFEGLIKQSFDFED